MSATLTMKHPAMVRSAEALLPALFAAAFIAVYALKSQGLATILTFSASMAAAYVCYLLTSFRRMPEPGRVLPLYLLALAVQMLHFMEEFVAKFQTRFPQEIFHAPPFTDNEFVISQTALFFLAIIGALGIYKQWKIPMVMVWFLIIMLQLVNAVQHPLYAIMTHGYFPGLFTSFPGWILGPLLFIRMWKAGRRTAENR